MLLWSQNLIRVSPGREDTGSRSRDEERYEEFHCKSVWEGTSKGVGRG